jgi:hypothetical protein
MSTVVVPLALAVLLLGLGLLLATGFAKAVGRDVRAKYRLLGCFEFLVAGLALSGAGTVSGFALGFAHIAPVVTGTIYAGFLVYLVIRRQGAPGDRSCDCFGSKTEIRAEHIGVVTAVSIASVALVWLSAAEYVRHVDQFVAVSVVAGAVIGGWLLMTLLDRGRDAFASWHRSTDPHTPTWIWYGGVEHAGSEGR